MPSVPRKRACRSSLGQYGVFAADPTPFFYPEPDQIHPNDLGHAKLAEVMSEALEPYVARVRAVA